MSLETTSPKASASRVVHGVVLTLLFLITRRLNMWLWQIPSVSFVQNDVSYYNYWLSCLVGGTTDERCLRALEGPGVMTEYPLPAVWFLELLYTLAGGIPAWVPWFMAGTFLAAIALSAVLHRVRPRLAPLPPLAAGILNVAVWFVAALPLRTGAHDAWLAVFAVTMLLLDALVAIFLFRHGTTSATVFWILFIGACGPIVWFRFDILTAAAVALACLWLVRHPHASGALIGIGAAIKLWPALLIGPLAAPNPRRSGHHRLVGFLLAGLSLGLASLLFGGWSRSISPITWQSLRGLQIESVPATPLLVMRAFTHETAWEVKLSNYNAIELFGPGVNTMLHFSTVLTIGSLTLTAAITWRLFRTRNAARQQTQAILLSVLAVVLATVIANKTLSTQYVQWLAGPFAALLALGSDDWLKRPRRLIALGLLAVAILTQYTYPWGAYGIMGTPYASGFDTSTLIARNVLLVMLTGFTAALAWHAAGRDTADATEEVR